MVDTTKAHVVAIALAPTAGDAMQLVPEAEAIAGAGLRGDRYAIGVGMWSKGRVGKRQVTFIALEDIVTANEVHRKHFNHLDSRRNVLVTGIGNLNDLIGHEFTIGTARFKGVKYCDPCNRPDELSEKEGFKDAFADTAGLISEVLISGTFRPDDEIFFH